MKKSTSKRQNRPTLMMAIPNDSVFFIFFFLLQFMLLLLLVQRLLTECLHVIHVQFIRVRVYVEGILNSKKRFQFPSARKEKSHLHTCECTERPFISLHVIAMCLRIYFSFALKNIYIFLFVCLFVMHKRRGEKHTYAMHTKTRSKWQKNDIQKRFNYF